MSWALSGHAVVPEKARSACALASWQGRLHLGWTGTDCRLNTIESADGVRFAAKRTLGHQSYRAYRDSDGDWQVEPLAPALTATPTGPLLAWTGTDGRPNVCDVGPGQAGHTTLPERSLAAPAIDAVGAHVALAWTGTDRRLNVSYGQSGRFAPPSTLTAKSSHSPAICSLGATLVVGWAGTDRRLNILELDGSAGPRPAVTRAKTSRAPALCAYGRAVVVAWRGTDRHINVMAYWPGHGTGGHTTLAATTSHAPALAVHGSRLLLAWTGADARPNVAHLDPPRS